MDQHFSKGLLMLFAPDPFFMSDFICVGSGLVNQSSVLVINHSFILINTFESYSLLIFSYFVKSF